LRRNHPLVSDLRMRDSRLPKNLQPVCVVVECADGCQKACDDNKPCSATSGVNSIRQYRWKWCQFHLMIARSMATIPCGLNDLTKAVAEVSEMSNLQQWRIGL